MADLCLGFYRKNCLGYFLVFLSRKLFFADQHGFISKNKHNLKAYRCNPAAPFSNDAVTQS